MYIFKYFEQMWKQICSQEGWEKKEKNHVVGQGITCVTKKKTYQYDIIQEVVELIIRKH